MRGVMLSLVVVLFTNPAHAFHNETEFERAAELGGGAGMFFTGSRSGNGFDCSICHVDAERRMTMTIESHPPGLITERRYTPGETYHLVIAMQNEHAGVDMMLNRNTFLMEILDDEMSPVGEYHHPSEPTTELVDDAVLAGRGARSAITEWSVEWTAPEDVGALTIYLAGVDGDGAEGGRLAPDGDPWNDDVYAGQLRVLPAGAEPEPVEAAGCSAAGSTGAWSMVWILGLLGWRRRAWGLLALGTLAFAGCDDSGDPPVDCTRVICSPDGGTSDGAMHDAPHHEDDGGHDTGPDAFDAGPVFPDAEVDAAEPDTGPLACDGTDVVREGAGAFCMNSCYCRSPERCFALGEAAGCCEDDPVCPTGGEPWAGCAPRDTIMVGDGVGCVHGQCYCMTDNHCFPERVAAGCCAGEIVCF